MQRTRLRRAPAEAVSSQKTFAGQVAGQTRRAAGAIVGRWGLWEGKGACGVGVSGAEGWSRWAFGEPRRRRTNR